MWKVTVKWDTIPNKYNYLAKSHNGWHMFRQKPQFIPGVCDLPEQWMTCGEGEGARLDYPEDFLSVRNDNSNHRATGSLEKNSLQTRPIVVADAQPKSGLVIKWALAPDWAKFAVCDMSGFVYLHSHPPKMLPCEGRWTTVQGRALQAGPESVYRNDPSVSWKWSLTARPGTLLKEETPMIGSEAKVDKRTAYDKQADDLLTRSKKERAHAEKMAASAKFLKSKEFKAIVAEAERCGLKIVATGHCS